LCGGQRSIDSAVVLEQLLAALQPDQTALRNAVDLLADGNDLIFQVANTLAGLELSKALLKQGANPLPKGRIPEVEDRVVADGER
jgi:hypothetical protein